MLRNLMWLVAGATALVVAAFFFCAATWSGLVFAADLWIPGQTGIFMEFGRLTMAGIIRNPRGVEVYALETRLVAFGVMLGSVMLTVWAGAVLRAVVHRLGTPVTA